MRQVERNALVERFLPFIHHVAREMRRRVPVFEYDDIVQIATLAFIECCNRMDPVSIDTPDEAKMFRSFIGTRMRGAVMDEVRRTYPKAMLHRNYRVTSLDKFITESFHEDEPASLAAQDNPEDEALGNVFREQVLSSLDSPLQRAVIDLAFFKDHKTGEVAKRLDRSRCHTSKVKREALNKLSVRLGAA